MIRENKISFFSPIGQEGELFRGRGGGKVNANAVGVWLDSLKDKILKWSFCRHVLLSDERHLNRYNNGLWAHCVGGLETFL